jgi:mono/diheme cytochrome c family protein
MALSLVACGGGGSSGGDKNSDAEGVADDGHYTQVSAAVPSTAPSTATSTVATINGTLGKTLYNQNCAACHGLGSKSSAAVSANTMGAIASNRGGMGSLSAVITQTEVDSIALYLTNPTAF